MPEEVSQLDDLLKGIVEAEYHALALINATLSLAREDLANRVNLVLQDLTAWRAEVLSREIELMRQALEVQV
jgi:hypothetical protein